MDKQENTSDGMMVSGDFTLLSSKKILSPQSIEILTQYMVENPYPKIVMPSKVVFHGVQKNNSPNEKFNCCFKFTSSIDSIQSGDIIAICEVGWKRLKEIICYVPAEVNSYDKWISMYSIVFEVDNIPKGSGEYELCYISEGNILGTSNQFTFRTAPESDVSVISFNEYIEVEDPHDPGLVVFKARNTQSSAELLEGSMIDFGNIPASTELLSNSQISLSSLPQILSSVKKMRVEDDLSSITNEGQNKNEIMEQNLPNIQMRVEDHLSSITNEGQNKNEIMEQNLPNIQEFENGPTCNLVLPNIPEVRILSPTSDKSILEDNCSGGFTTMDSSCASNSISSRAQHQSDILKIVFGLDEIRTVVNEVAKSIPLAVLQITSTLQNMKDSTGPLASSVTESGSNSLISKVNDNLVQFDGSSSSVEGENNKSGKIWNEEDYVSQVKENQSMREELQELKESNTYLKSRISVLEVELSNLNDEKHNLLMQCINSYEQENYSLKEELEKHFKFECEIESLKTKNANIEAENLELKKYFQKVPSSTLVLQNSVFLENKSLKSKCSDLEKEISVLKKTVETESVNHKSSKVVRELILKQGHELAAMRTECREIGDELITIIKCLDQKNLALENVHLIKKRLIELYEKCTKVVLRKCINTSELEENITGDEGKEQLISELASMRTVVENLQKQNETLREKLVLLRKQTVGKVSLQVWPK